MRITKKNWGREKKKIKKITEYYRGTTCRDSWAIGEVGEKKAEIEEARRVSEKQTKKRKNQKQSNQT